MNMRKRAFALALLLIVTALSSCGSDTPDPTGDPLPSGEPQPTGVTSTPTPEEIGQEALKIGDVSISVAEFDFYYNEAYHSIVEMYESVGFLEYLGLDTSLPFSEQEYEEGVTWQDYFKETAIDSLIGLVLQSEEAKKDGLTLTENDYARIDSELESMRQYAEEEEITTDALLQSVYGSEMNEQRMRIILERSYLADRYWSTAVEGYAIGENEISEYYEQHKGDFSYVDFHNFIFDAELYEENLGRVPTEDEQKSFKEAQKTLAQKLYNKITTAAKFRADAEEFLDEDEVLPDEEDEDEDEDITYQEGVYVSDLEAQQAAFLSDPKRKAGDKILIEGDGYFEIILFVDRYDPMDEDWKLEVSEILQEERFATQIDALRGNYPVTENPEGMALAMKPLPE